VNVLCVDVDSTIANLALMRLSAFHKARGDLVSLSRGPYIPIDAAFTNADRVYVSCVFTWNAARARRIAASFDDRGIEVELGGTGVDLVTRLPFDIEAVSPDYDLYGVDYAVGFCVRGCNRRCQFCIVPIKEGRINPDEYRHPSTWVPSDRKKAMLLDNDIALYDDRLHDEILGWFRDSGVKVSITQGYDIRCIDERRAGFLYDLKPSSISFDRTRLYVAWDYVGIEGWVRRGLPMLLAAGFKPRQIMVYCIVGFDTTRDGDFYRFKVLTDGYGVSPFVMRYNNRHDDRWLNAFSRWVNRGVYRFVPWERYEGNPEPEWSYDERRPRTRSHEPTMVEFHAKAQAEAIP